MSLFTKSWVMLVKFRTYFSGDRKSVILTLNGAFSLVLLLLVVTTISWGRLARDANDRRFGRTARDPLRKIE